MVLFAGPGGLFDEKPDDGCQHGEGEYLSGSESAPFIKPCAELIDQEGEDIG